MVNAAHQDFIANAIALKPTIRQYREELDSGNRLPPELARQLNEAGLFQLALPRSMGGPESDPLTSFRVIEELSRVDGSVGWCAMLSSSCSLFAGWLKADIGRAMFGQPPDFRMAGSIRPQGEALVVDGGYHLRGQWDYASGVHHANWLLCTCKLVDANGPLTNPDGTPQIDPLTGQDVVRDQKRYYSSFQFVGGDTQVVYNLEYRIPIMGPVTLAPFFDIGRSWVMRRAALTIADNSTAGLVVLEDGAFRPVRAGEEVQVIPGTDDWRASTGVELQIIMPVVNAPFRLIFGYNPLRFNEFVPNPTGAAPIPIIFEKRSDIKFSVGRTF